MIHLKQGLLLGLASLVQHGASQNWDGPSPYPGGIAPDVVVEDGWKSSHPPVEGVHTTHPTTINGVDDTSESVDTTGLKTRDAKDFYLRILPLGASDGNGYRKLLRQQLRWKGWKVNMVGTKNDGTMSDNVRCLLLSS
jgi:hypothetical protein